LTDQDQDQDLVEKEVDKINAYKNQLQRSTGQTELKMQQHSVPRCTVLPEEIWVKIFKFLPQKHLLKSSLVCKEFHCYSMSPVLWKNLDLELSFAKLDLIKRCTLLTNLQLRGPESCPSSLEVGLETWARDVMDSLVETLTAHCEKLEHLETWNCPYLSQDQLVQLKQSNNCCVKQTINFMMNKFESGDTGSWVFEDKELSYQHTHTTDYYRRGNPYKILSWPGSSSVSICFNIPSLESVSSVIMFLNHCRTTADGVVYMEVNGDPAEKIEDGSFVKKVVMAPRFNFGVESFHVDLELLQSGSNTITICLDSSSPGVYWLSDVKIETAFC